MRLLEEPSRGTPNDSKGNPEPRSPDAFVGVTAPESPDAVPSTTPPKRLLKPREKPGGATPPESPEAILSTRPAPAKRLSAHQNKHRKDVK